MKNDDLWITLDGVESNGDGTGTLLQNPVGHHPGDPHALDGHAERQH